MPLQRPGRVEPQTAVERRLTAEAEEDAVGPLPPDHRLHEERRDGVKYTRSATPSEVCTVAMFGLIRTVRIPSNSFSTVC